MSSDKSARWQQAKATGKDFEDAREWARANPRTFEVPTPHDLRCIVVGQSHIKISNGQERFWVKVEDAAIVDGEACYLGVVSNRLVDGRAYDEGDLVWCLGWNVYGIEW